MNRPLISVTLPNYNYGRFLGEAFDSVLAQTYENFEILFVEDGSTDESRAIAEKYALQDSRVKAVFFEKNQGALPAHANTWQRATGELVYQYSSDDALIDINFFRSAVDALENNPRAAGFYGIAAMVGTESGEILGYMGKSSPEGYIAPAVFLPGFLNYQIFVPGIAAIWRKKGIDSLGGYDYRLGPQADYFINHALPAQYGVVYQEVPFAKARVSTQRKSFSSNTTIRDEMGRLALFEKKMRQVTGQRPDLATDWKFWRQGQAAQLIEKYGRESAAAAGRTSAAPV